MIEFENMHSNNITGKKPGPVNLQIIEEKNNKIIMADPAGPDTPLLEAGGCVVVLLRHAARSPE